MYYNGVLMNDFSVCLIFYSWLKSIFSWFSIIEVVRESWWVGEMYSVRVKGLSCGLVSGINVSWLDLILLRIFS